MNFSLEEVMFRSQDTGLAKNKQLGATRTSISIKLGGLRFYQIFFFYSVLLFKLLFLVYFSQLILPSNTTSFLLPGLPSKFHTTFLKTILSSQTPFFFSEYCADFSLLFYILQPLWNLNFTGVKSQKY